LIALSVLDTNKIDKILKYKASNSYKTNLKKYNKIIGNVKPRMARQKTLSENEIEQIVKKYRQGFLIKDLADEYSCHRETVSNHLKKNGVEVRRGRRLR
jgi:DNA-binding NarL/FixJ family response regulator